MADPRRILKALNAASNEVRAAREAGSAISKAATEAGMSAPVTANRNLTTLQDFHTSLGDRVRERAMKAQQEMDQWNYKYAPGQHVFTEHGASNNLPPLRILERARSGNQVIRQDHPTLGPGLGKPMIDPQTGKAMRTPYEPGYRVRRQNSPDPEDYAEFIIPESAIKGDIEFRRGGGVHMQGGGGLGVIRALTAVDKEAKAIKAAREAEEASRLAKILEAKTPPMTTPQGTGLPLMPRSQGMYTPGVPQVALQRQQGRGGKYTERMQDLLDSPTARKKVDQLISKGEELGMREWYGTEPLRQVAMDIGMSPEKFNEFMGQMASASQRNPVDQQNRMGSYLWHLSQTGQLPEDAFLLTNKIKKNPALAPQGTPIEMPPGYGSLAQGDIFSRGKQIAHGDIEGALPEDKKLGTFHRNLMGNLKPVTVDVNAVRGPVIERGDPRWLTSKLVEKDENGNVVGTYFPRKMVDEGEMSIREAKQRPGFWEAAPKGSEYAGFEELWQRAAKRAGVAPAEAQALGWYGSADVTALKTKPELYVDNLERLIKRTAEQTGKSPQEVMKDMLTGKGFLYKKGGSVRSHDDINAELAQHGYHIPKPNRTKTESLAKGGKVHPHIQHQLNELGYHIPEPVKVRSLKERRFADGGFAEPLAAPEYTTEGSDTAQTIRDYGSALKKLGINEIKSLKKPRALTDIVNKGVIANNPISAGVDLVNMGLGAVGLGSEEPFLGSEHVKRLMEKTGMATTEERPLLETAASFVSPAGMLKTATGLSKTGKMSAAAKEAKTVSAGTPTGANYVTAQEGPFFRVRPKALGEGEAAGSGVREIAGGVSQAQPAGTGSVRGKVPTRLTDEEVARVATDPENIAHKTAREYTKKALGTDYTVLDIPPSSLAKQSAIGRSFLAGVEGSLEYKQAVFEAYKRRMPEVISQTGAEHYDDLLEKAYRQLGKETNEQFQHLPINMSFHKAGEGDYIGSPELLADVHGNRHMYVYQGGEKHPYLSDIDPETGLNANEKFRAVHDFFGHAAHGHQFGPKGEEAAFAAHSQMYSPLARLAMAAETRGQNSVVNYSPLNAELKATLAQLDEQLIEAKRRGNTDLANQIKEAKKEAFKGFQFAPNQPVLLPPEFVDPHFVGGMPAYMQGVIQPAPGTTAKSTLTHFSHEPNLTMTDPNRYGTGIKGQEAERLEYPGAVKPRTYFYAGEPESIAPEPGLGVNRFKTESDKLYDLSADPLKLKLLAREANRTPFSAKYNAGMRSPTEELNDVERMIKEYGYEGYIAPHNTKPAAVLFHPKHVQRHAEGGAAYNTVPDMSDGGQYLQGPPFKRGGLAMTRK